MMRTLKIWRKAKQFVVNLPKTRKNSSATASVCFEVSYDEKNWLRCDEHAVLSWNEEIACYPHARIRFIANAGGER